MPSDDLAARVAALEARLQELEDDRAIRQLLARYGFHADLGRSDAYVELYTEDGAIDSGASRRWEGRDDLRQFITNPQGHKSIEGRCLHLQGNNLVTHIQGDAAVAESYSVVLVREDDGLRLFACNVNRWTLRKVEGHWKIRERLIRSPGTGGFTEVLAAEGYTALLAAP